MTAVPAGQQIRICKTGCLLNLRRGISASRCNTVIPVRKYFYNVSWKYFHIIVQKLSTWFHMVVFFLGLLCLSLGPV